MSRQARPQHASLTCLFFSNKCTYVLVFVWVCVGAGAGGGLCVLLFRGSLCLVNVHGSIPTEHQMCDKIHSLTIRVLANVFLRCFPYVCGLSPLAPS